MIEFIQRYWLEVFFGCIVSALSLVVRSIWARIQKETAEQQVMKAAALAMMHDRIYSLARYYIAQGYATIQDLDNMEHIYTGFFQHLCKCWGINLIDASFSTFRCYNGKFIVQDHIWDCLTERFYKKNCETCTIF